MFEEERQSTKYALYISKVIYLEKLHQYSEASLCLDELWQEIEHVDATVKLNMYELRAILLRKQQKYQQAIHYANLGIDLARREHNYDLLLDLWTTLGGIYKDLGNVPLAKASFSAASAYESKIKYKQLLSDTSKELGLLFLQEGDMENAEKTFFTALKQCRQDKPRKCSILIALSDVYLQTKQYHAAIQQLITAFQLAEQHSYQIHLHNIVFKLAQCYKCTNQNTLYQKFSTHFLELTEQLTKGGNEPMGLLMLSPEPPTN